jgi:replicative DNA helicase
MIEPAPIDLPKPRRRAPRSDRHVSDRLAPHSIEAEQGVLGSVFLDPNKCLPECIEKFKQGPAVFYDLRHQTIYELLVEMFDKKGAIDVITVQQRLKDKQQLESVGGIGYLAALPDTVPSAANVAFYINIVREKFLLRRYLATFAENTVRIYEHEGEVDALADGIERDVLAIAQERVEGKTTDIKTLVAGTIDTLEKWHANQGALQGLSTGFPDLDRMTTGMHGGEMIVIAARPSLGKTSIALNIAEAVAIDQKLPVGVFSLEMTSEALVLRMLCSRARVNLRNVREGFFSERDFPKITSAAGKISGAPFHIDDTPGMSILQLRAKARRMWQQHGIKLFVIDYLQLLHSNNRRAENRQQEIADISNGVKALAKELNVPVIVLAQLNRDIEKEKNRKPRMSDLRESGAIEQDADLIGLLYKPASEDEDESLQTATGARADSIAVNLLIAKQRNGPTGDVELTFFRTYTRFESAAKIQPEDGQ